MTDMTTTTDLVKRLEAGETGREIEVAIFHALSSAQMPASIAIDSVDAQWNWLSYFHSGWTGITTSLDAAVALVERVKPGWRKGFRQHDDIEGDGWFAWLNSPDYRTECYAAGGETRTSVASGTRFNADAPTPAAALIAALLKAKGAGDE